MKSQWAATVIRSGTLAGSWILAIIVAWFAGTATYIASLSAPFLISMFSSSDGGWVQEGAFLASCALTGAMGVLAGTLCLGVASRRIGSVILLLLGLSYHYYFWARMTALRSDVAHPAFTMAAALAVGGVSVVAWFVFRTAANKTLQATAAPPGS